MKPLYQPLERLLAVLPSWAPCTQASVFHSRRGGMKHQCQFLPSRKIHFPVPELPLDTLNNKLPHGTSLDACWVVPYFHKP